MQEHKAGSVVQSVGLHILTKTVSDFVTLSESGRLQAGSILWRRKKQKNNRNGPRRSDKTSNDKEFDCIRARGGISGDQCVFVRSSRRPHSDLRAASGGAATAPLPC